VIDTFNDLVELITRDSLTTSHVGYDSYDSTVSLNVFGLRHYNARLYPDPGEILVVNLRLTHRNRRNGDKAQDIPRFVNDVSLNTPKVYNCKLVASNLLHPPLQKGQTSARDHVHFQVRLLGRRFRRSKQERRPETLRFEGRA